MVERDEYRLPKTNTVGEKFSLFLIYWDDTKKLLLLFESGFDDTMNMENENIQNSHHKVFSKLECLEMWWNDLNMAKLRCCYIIFNLHSSVSLEMSTWEELGVGICHQPQSSLPSPLCQCTVCSSTVATMKQHRSPPADSSEVAWSSTVALWCHTLQVTTGRTPHHQDWLIHGFNLLALRYYFT